MLGSGFLVGILILIGIGIIVILFLDVIFEYIRKLINKLAEKLGIKQRYRELKLKSFKDHLYVALNVVMAILVALFSLGTAIKSTIFDSDFVAEEVKTLDVETVAGVTREILSRNLPPQQQYASVTLDSTIQELGPWLREQACTIVQQSYGYFLREKPDLHVSISLEPLRQCLRKNLKNSLSNSPEFKYVAPEQIESTIDYTYFMAFGGIPEEFVVSSTSSNPETITTLNQITQFVLWYEIAYWLLLVLIFLIVFLIVRISVDFQLALQVIGVNLMSGGILGYIYSFVIIEVVKLATRWVELSSSQNWLISVMSVTISRTKAPGITIIIAGLFIFALSFAVPYYWRLKKAKAENLCQPSTSKAESNR